MKNANGPNEPSEYRQLERTFAELANNAQWVADNHAKSKHTTASIALAPVNQPRLIPQGK